MPAIILYSTNVWLKFLIQRDYLNDRHHVWCSENFDSQTLGRYQQGAQTPPSSNPADIYRDLKRAIERKDQHDLIIAQKRLTLINLAVDLEKKGEITDSAKQEIIYRVNNAQWDDWHPLIYVIPRQPVGHRLLKVPIDKRASGEIEYIIRDVTSNEFDLIEL